MTSAPIILSCQTASAGDARLASLAQFLGLDCTTLDGTAFSAECNHGPDHRLCVLANANTLSHWCGNGPERAAALIRLCQKTRFLFVYGFSAESDSISFAHELTNGQISDVRRFERTNFEYEVSSFHSHLTKEFSSLRFGPIQPQVDFAFVFALKAGDLHPLISIAGLPFWTISQAGGCTVLLLACTEIADIQEKVIEGNLDAARYFSRLLPAAMFLKWAFKDRCWHTEHRFANLTIDDPLLRDSYGHLKYQNLLRQMDASNFATTIAFIPWNYKRTHKTTAQLFGARPDRLSLCVHGCNHTRAEFATSNLAALNHSVRLASQRMNAHRLRTGLNHAAIMVFPQGRFSPEALTVLKSNNYLAAVNSCARPSVPSTIGDLRLSDFLEPALTKLGGAPLYLRRDPGGLERFALDLFFGKPLLVVEHHAYLNDGGLRLTEFIARLNSIGALEWRGLGEVVEKTYLQRHVSREIAACKLYSNSQVVENQSDHDRLFLVSASSVDDVPIEHISINGRTSAFTTAGGTIQFPIEIPANASAKVNILYTNTLPSSEPEASLRATARIWTRRMLSEFRDNVLCKSDLLMAGARAVSHGLFGERLKSLSQRQA